MNFFDLAISNAYILYKHNCALCDVRPVRQFKFRLEITRSLLEKGKRARAGTKARTKGTVDTEEGNSTCELVGVSAIKLKRGKRYYCTRVKRPKIGSAGQTNRPMSQSHRAASKTNLPVYKHFTDPRHNFEKDTILEKTTEARLHARETHWIRTLDTVWPKGLNSKFENH
jgi:hypothetical protein